MILNYNESRQVVFVLLATKATKSLRQALDFFATRFFEMFDMNDFNAGEIAPFKAASELVAECFGFIPE
jgi:hypothetical protein